MQISRRQAGLRAAAAAALAACLLAGEAGAIPAFSRKYRTSCNTCHVAYPKLNDFGMAFYRNGFQFPRDDEFFVKDAPVTMAARAWRDLWPGALWPSDLPNLPPVSFRASMGMDQEERAEVQGDLRAPVDVNILAAGTFGRDISFFFHQGGGIRYYVQFSNLFEDALQERLLPRYALNVRMGLFEPELLPLSNARRLSVTPLLTHTHTYSRNNEAGNAFQIDRQIGVELHGVLGHRLRYTAGLVNGNGDASDNNSAKDVYGRLAFKAGGMRFSGEEPESAGDEEPSEGDPLFRSDANTDNSLTLGACFWLGRFTAFDSSRSENYAIDFKRVGLDARANLWLFDLVGGVLHGFDENGLNENYDLASTVWYCALDAVPWPWLVLSGRYAKIRFGGPGTGALAGQETSRFVLTGTALVRANLKLSLEGRFDEYLGLPGTGNDALLLRLDYSF